MKEKIGNFLLRRKLKKQNRKQVFLGMQKAKTVGILFDATNLDNYHQVKTLAKQLVKAGKGVKVLGYSHSKEKDSQYIGDNNNGFICKKDFNLFYQTKDDYTVRFINFDFDLLFVVSDDMWFPLKYISHLSNASFKISKKSLSDEIFDLMIDVPKKTAIKIQIEQMLYYLNMLTGSEKSEMSVI